MTETAQEAPVSLATDPSTGPMLVSQEIWFTRDMAAKAIETMIPTRNLKHKNIQKWAVDMREGRWRRNGSTIKLMNGRMFDGQNRMHAFMLSGLDGIWFLVANEAEDGSVKVTDLGTSRSLGDIIAVNRALPDSKFIGSVLSRIWVWDVHGEHITRRTANTNPLILDQYFDEHEDEILAAATFGAREEYGTRAYRESSIRVLTTKNAFAVTRLLLRRIDPDAAESFMHDLAEGGSTGPVSTLRTRLGRDRMRQIKYKDTSNGKSWPIQEAGRVLTFRVWNNLHTPGEKPLTKLQFPDDVVNNFPFPVTPVPAEG
jgi:hypothetical protein